MKKKSGLLKKIFATIVGLFLIMVAAAVVLPLVVDVDKYRPLIVQKANENLNGELKLGKLSLSLWGQIRINIEELLLEDQKDKTVVAVKDAYFHLPFVSILSGAPEVVLRMKQPEINIVKDASGTYNVMKLVKELPADKSKAEEGAASEETAQKEEPAADSQAMEIPGIAARARLGVDFSNATVVYRDVAQNLTTKLDRLNFVVKNLSLSRPADILFWADLDTTMGKDLKVSGPFKLEAKAETELKDRKIDRIKLDAKLDLDDLRIVMPETFIKEKGTTANARAVLSVTPRDAVIENLEIKFLNAVVKSSGVVRNLEKPVVEIKVSSNEIDLKPWGKLLPPAKDYDLSGSTSFNAEVKGPAESLVYSAKLEAKNVSAKGPYLKAKPRFDASVDIQTNKVRDLLLKMTAPKTELVIKGGVESFSSPDAKFTITSPGMNLDEWVDFEAMSAASEAQAKAAAAQAPQGQTTPGATSPKSVAVPAEEDLDALLAPMKEIPVMKQLRAEARVKIDSLQAYGVLMTEMTGKLTFANLAAQLDRFGFKLWDGTVSATSSMDLKPKRPTYSYQASMENLDLQKAVSSQMKLLKNTVVGIADFSMKGTGSSFNPNMAKVNLDATGAMRIEDATFKTIDVVKMAADALNKAIERLEDKYPALKNRRVKAKMDRKAEYEFISSGLTIKKGLFRAPDFFAKAKPNQGLDIKGDTKLGMLDYKVDANWLIIDTYDVLNAKSISGKIGGVQVDELLAEKGQPVKFPVTVGCTAFEPCYSYTEVPEFLAKVALGKASGAAQSKATEEARKKIEEKAKDLGIKPPPAVKKKAKDLIKKFKF